MIKANQAVADAASTNDTATADTIHTENAKRERTSLEDKIKKAKAELDGLIARKKEADRAEQERRDKAVRALIKAERLDEFSPEVWRAALPAIRAALQTAAA